MRAGEPALRMRHNVWHDLGGNKVDMGILLRRLGVVQQERDVSPAGSRRCEYQCRGAVLGLCYRREAGRAWFSILAQYEIDTIAIRREQVSGCKSSETINDKTKAQTETHSHGAGGYRVSCPSP